MSPVTEPSTSQSPSLPDSEVRRRWRRGAAKLAVAVLVGALQVASFVGVVGLVGPKQLWGNGGDGVVLLAGFLAGVAVALLGIVLARRVAPRRAPRLMAEAADLAAVQAAALFLLVAVGMMTSAWATFGAGWKASVFTALHGAPITIVFGFCLMSIPATVGSGVALAMVALRRRRMPR